MEFYIDRPGGVRLYGTADMPPVTTTAATTAAKAAVLLMHGFTEHGAHYAYAARRLVDAGYAVYRPDSRGHGRSAAGEGPLDGYGVQDYIADADAFVAYIKQETGLPVFMMGHSMGAMITCAYGVTHHDQLAGQLTTGALCEHPPALSGMPGVETVPDTAVLHTFDIAGMVRAEDEADPLIVRAVTMGYARRLFLEGPEYVAKHAKQHRYPILMVHGQRDKLVPYAVSFRFLSESASPDKTLVLRPNGEHSMLREKDEQTPVLDTMLAWLDRRVNAMATPAAVW